MADSVKVTDEGLELSVTHEEVEPDVAILPTYMQGIIKAESAIFGDAFSTVNGGIDSDLQNRTVQDVIDGKHVIKGMSMFRV